jgi:hypothetical protein
MLIEFPSELLLASPVYLPHSVGALVLLASSLVLPQVQQWQHALAHLCIMNCADSGRFFEPDVGIQVNVHCTACVRVAAIVNSVREEFAREAAATFFQLFITACHALVCCPSWLCMAYVNDVLCLLECNVLCIFQEVDVYFGRTLACELVFEFECPSFFCS